MYEVETLPLAITRPRMTLRSLQAAVVILTDDLGQQVLFWLAEGVTVTLSAAGLPVPLTLLK